MAGRLRVGVVGLGRRWQRYRGAVEGPDSPVDVRAVADVSPRRATAEARRLHCEAAEGVVDLLDRPDVDAVLFFEAPWHGLWTLERAARSGKPVFCAAPLTGDVSNGSPGNVANAPAMAALPAGAAPVVGRLRVLLDKHLGPARVISVWAGTGRSVTGEALLGSTALLSCLHLCGELSGSSPDSVSAVVPAGAGLVNLTIAFPGGRTALVLFAAGRRAAWRVAAIAEKGMAEASLPRRLRWRDAAGHHGLRLPAERGPSVLLRRFAEAVADGRPPRPSLADAARALSWLRAARDSHRAGRPVRPGG